MASLREEQGRSARVMATVAPLFAALATASAENLTTAAASAGSGDADADDDDAAEELASLWFVLIMISLFSFLCCWFVSYRSREPVRVVECASYTLDQRELPAVYLASY